MLIFRGVIPHYNGITFLSGNPDFTSPPFVDSPSGTTICRFTMNEDAFPMSKWSFFPMSKCLLSGGNHFLKSPSGNLILHPWSLTWNLKINPWKSRFLLETIIFRFHVKLWGCYKSSHLGTFVFLRSLDLTRHQGREIRWKNLRTRVSGGVQIFCTWISWNELKSP